MIIQLSQHGRPMGYAIEPVSPRPWQDVQVPVRPVGKDIQNMRQVVLMCWLCFQQFAFPPECQWYVLSNLSLAIFPSKDKGHKLVEPPPETRSSTSTVPTNSLSSTASLVGVPWPKHWEFPLGKRWKTCNGRLLNWSILVLTVWPVWRIY